MLRQTKDMDADASDASSMDWNDASGYDMDWYGLNLSITFYDYMCKMCWCWCWWIFHGWYDYYVEGMEVELRFRFGIEADRKKRAVPGVKLKCDHYDDKHGTLGVSRVQKETRMNWSWIEVVGSRIQISLKKHCLNIFFEHIITVIETINFG